MYYYIHLYLYIVLQRLSAGLLVWSSHPALPSCCAVSSIHAAIYGPKDTRKSITTTLFKYTSMRHDCRKSFTATLFKYNALRHDCRKSITATLFKYNALRHDCRKSITATLFKYNILCDTIAESLSLRHCLSLCSATRLQKVYHCDTV